MMEMEETDKERLVTSPIVVTVANDVVFPLIPEVCLGVKKKKTKMVQPQDVCCQWG